MQADDKPHVSLNKLMQVEITFKIDGETPKTREM